MGNARLEWFDLFRGVAAILVVTFHFDAFLGVPWFEFGFVAVDMFFVLSGIVLGVKYSAAIREGLSFKKFAELRLKRLYPMAFIAGVFIVALNLSGVPSRAWPPAANFGAWTVFLITPYPYFPGLHGAFPADAPLWSLWAELVTNVVWFVTMKAKSSWMAALSILTCAGMVVLAWKLQTLNYGGTPGLAVRMESLVRAFAWFSVGYWIAIRRPEIPIHPLLLVLGVVLTMIASAVDLQPAWLISLATAVFGAVLMAKLLHVRAPARRTARVAYFLGIASYPLYLIHAPAGRLLPYVPAGMAHWLQILLVIGGATFFATWLNEAVVRFLSRKRRHPSTTP